MGGTPSKPQSATFERNDHPTSVKVSDDLVRHLAEAQGVRAGGRPQQAQQQQQPTRGDHERIRLLEEELKAQKENIEHLLKAAKEEGEREGREAAERLISEKQQKVTLAVLEQEAERLGQQEEARVKAFDQLATDLKTRFSVPAGKPRPCTESEKSVLECYLKNPKRSMDCADEVRAFSECADKFSQGFLSGQTAQ